MCTRYYYLLTLGHLRESTFDCDRLSLVPRARGVATWRRDAQCERYVTPKQDTVTQCGYQWQWGVEKGRSKAEPLGRMCTVAARSRYSFHSASGCDFVLCVMSAGIYVLHERTSPPVQREGNEIRSFSCLVCELRCEKCDRQGVPKKKTRGV